jgi:hypothetical protein
MTPWHNRGLELEAEQGAYCFYAAWEEWIAKHDDQDVVGELDGIAKVHLFAMFERACEEATTSEGGG